MFEVDLDDRHIIGVACWFITTWSMPRAVYFSGLLCILWPLWIRIWRARR